MRGNEPLTPRELETLALLAAGNTTPDIARQLGVTPGTIKTHLTNMYRKIGVRNRIQATRYYLEHCTSHPLRPPPARHADETSPLIERQIRELEARLDELAPATAEAERLQHALKALRGIES
ncbi:response regulator transcription factor [Solirubrobacter sp. CPCC 204708]|uniref:LuxR C-terminal-related transcriptional regulator n=1 Tax=Solirubrobacter deserti TaxID=2282478 RepID=A0ABT4RKF0_9ACTN|nr:LuxR C-terminal-related transcriptional regulator [Solirubrobacter deserti]MBE2317289.1 response regulator transcription factor [Solirubrobacter deserti]MDA0139020.1 LuxR C-terminal-related transcriptional regulator [Solirubrobacter deserti]